MRIHCLLAYGIGFQLHLRPVQREPANLHYAHRGQRKFLLSTDLTYDSKHAPHVACARSEGAQLYDLRPVRLLD